MSGLMAARAAAAEPAVKPLEATIEVRLEAEQLREDGAQTRSFALGDVMSFIASVVEKSPLDECGRESMVVKVHQLIACSKGNQFRRPTDLRT